ncbi:CocE/NonD family hydrolase C-terminal non-catalytic domain-containing protein [Streptomyces sp. SAI-127]|uniref:CocE/NonD family hydrolase C-terminal non-catalytic domain-containing protein n=1 Tax=Streptomyces sp. SAI-127 TaxID=2940543 RepID=UPI002475CABC|nr:CocE/NonD family hydrolase C-terminal non-catalytic domain-containing protein [Streptomyces sp. SAI-127]
MEAREDVLVFTTEPFAEDLGVTGRVRVVVFAATDGPSTDWVARLCDVDESGVFRNMWSSARPLPAVPHFAPAFDDRPAVPDLSSSLPYARPWPASSSPRGWRPPDPGRCGRAAWSPRSS